MSGTWLLPLKKQIFGCYKSTEKKHSYKTNTIILASVFYNNKNVNFFI